MCTFMRVCVCVCVEWKLWGSKRKPIGLLTADCFPDLCVCHTRLTAGCSKEKRK